MVPNIQAPFVQVMNETIAITEKQIQNYCFTFVYSETTTVLYCVLAAVGTHNQEFPNLC